MGSFYSGFGGHKSYIGHCEDGIIYRGSGNGNPIGRYEGGSIYNQFKEHVGSYSGGSIYNASGKHIASYENGIVYNSYLNVAVGKEQLGSYDGNPAEAAALVLLFIGGSDSSGGGSGDYGTSNSSDDGCLFALLAGLFNLLLSLILLIPYALKYLFLYVYFLIGATATIYYIGAMILCGVTGLVFLMFPLSFIPTAFVFISIPYWIILFTQKRKRNMSWKETLKYYKLWFFKGPWAYPYIIDLKNNGPQ